MLAEKLEVAEEIVMVLVLKRSEFEDVITSGVSIEEILSSFPIFPEVLAMVCSSVSIWVVIVSFEETAVVRPVLKGQVVVIDIVT